MRIQQVTTEYDYSKENKILWMIRKSYKETIFPLIVTSELPLI